MSDPIVAAVQADLAARSARGLLKYGVTLDRTDLAPGAWLQHLYEELLDAACYVKRIQYQLPDAAREGGGVTPPAATAVHVSPSQPATPPATCAGAGNTVPAAFWTTAACGECGMREAMPNSIYCSPCYDGGRP